MALNAGSHACVSNAKPPSYPTTASSAHPELDLAMLCFEPGSLFTLIVSRQMTGGLVCSQPSAKCRKAKSPSTQLQLARLPGSSKGHGSGREAVMVKLKRSK